MSTQQVTEQVADHVTDGRRRRRVPDAQILEAAVEEFAAAGFAGASMASVAARARTTKPTLYANVGTKDELYAAAVAAEADVLRGLLLGTYAASEQGSVGDQVRSGTRAIFRFAAERPHGFALLFAGQASIPLGSEATRAVHDDVVDAVARLVAHGLVAAGVTDPRAARLLASMTVAALHAAARDSVAGGLDLDAAASAAEAFVLAAFAHLDVAPLASL